MNTKRKITNLSATAAKMGVTSTWLLKHVRQGNIPAIKDGKNYIFNLEAVEKAILKLAKRGCLDD